MAINFTFLKNSKSGTAPAVVCVYDNKELTPSAKALDEKSGNLLSRFIDTSRSFQGKSGETVVIALPESAGFEAVVLLGLGDPAKLDKQSVEMAGGRLAKALLAARHNSVSILIDPPGHSPAIDEASLAAHLAAGIKLGAYQFEKYKTLPRDDDGEKSPGKTELTDINIVTDEHASAQDRFKTLDNVADGVIIARDLVNEPPNMLYPESFADYIRDTLKPLGVDVEILDEKKMQKLGMGAILAVGMGSLRPPRMVIMHWKGKGSGKGQPPAFIGKGITFDTGGVNIKPASGMEDMKLDMGGAATVTGLMYALAKNNYEGEVIGAVGLAENMPSHAAYRPSDIITTYSGKTVEVLNTDAEGRLVLADVLSYIQEKHNPSYMVDLATLTGAMMVALGFEYCGTFVNDDDLWDKLDKASKTSGEKLWRMPLDDAYSREVNGDFADIKNLGTTARYAGACTAAAFLEKFIDKDRPWAHMDIAGTAWRKSGTATIPKWGTGFGVRALYDLAVSTDDDSGA